MFKELGERNAELREALEHQTATSEVLGIISRSPTDVQPVLDAIVESAARVCGIDDVVLRFREGNSFVLQAHFGPMPIGRVEISIDEPQYHWMQEHGTLYIPDVRAQKISRGRLRRQLPHPLSLLFVSEATDWNADRASHPGAPSRRRRSNSSKPADQAVVAIENVRLFKELTEALEQQTATARSWGHRQLADRSTTSARRRGEHRASRCGGCFSAPG